MIFTFDDITVSDLYKDAYGHRPSYAYLLDWHSLSDKQKQDEWDLLLSAFAAREEHEQAIEDANVEAFHARIEQMLEDGAEDKTQAIRWICDAEGIDYNDPDVGYICFQLGLPYSMENDIRG